MGKQNEAAATLGRLGGLARARKYSKEDLSRWGATGGWPKGRPRKPKKTKAKK